MSWSGSRRDSAYRSDSAAPTPGIMAVRDAYKRSLPGRLVGVSVDEHGRPLYGSRFRLASSTSVARRATSNICTAQVLLAVMAGAYAVYHGPDGSARHRCAGPPHANRLAEGLLPRDRRRNDAVVRHAHGSSQAGQSRGRGRACRSHQPPLVDATGSSGASTRQ